MGFNKERMFVSKEEKEVELQVPLTCTKCDRINNPECGDEHDGELSTFTILVTGIPWAKLNYIKSQCVSFDEKQQTHFDSQKYVSECLKAMIVKAPWGDTNDIFLMQVGGPLGTALEGIIPSAYGGEDEDAADNFNSIKKE